MQLNNKTNLASQLALAATALIGSSASAEQAKDSWEFTGSVLAYSETDRVSAVEAIVTADKNYGDSGKLSYKVVLDTLTGASANGAIAQREAQTFTRPSGKGSYTIEAFDTPLDDTFRDTRAQFAVSWSDAIDENSGYTLGSNFSKEYDYLSLSINGEYSKTFDRKNTTLSLGGSLAFDQVSPEGGRPEAFATMVNKSDFANEDAFWNAFDATRQSGDGNIDTAEILLGLTQVINRRSLFQLNLSYAQMDGYLTDPFKLLSLVDSSATAQSYLYENRPGSRSQQALFGLYKYHLDESVVDFSYRFLTDDWGIDSHTLDLRWHLFTSGDSFWEPHIRFYQQSAADFYQPFLLQGQALPEFASADYRLGDMTALTLGLKYGFTLNGGSRAEIRAEYYQQTPDAKALSWLASTSDLDIDPQLDAFMLQFTYFF